MVERGPSSTALEVTRRAYRWAALAVGVMAMSTGSILVRLAQAPPLVQGAWRLVLASILLAPWAVPRLVRERKGLSRGDLVMLCLSGAALALHLAAWMSSLFYTIVASSVILVSTNPIYVALASHHLLGERVGKRRVLAIVVAVVGSVIVSYGDLRLSGEALLGDAMALLGALAMSAHILLGRVVRPKLSTLAYVWPCYGLAGLLMVIPCVASGQPLVGYGHNTLLMLLLLAIVPQMVGHSTFNWALGHVSPILVTLAILGEPVGASILAWLVLGEVPPLAAMVGGPMILAGIYLASKDEPALGPGHDDLLKGAHDIRQL